MAFKSEAQRRYMHKHLPLLAKKWEAEGSNNLPERIGPKKDKFKPRRPRIKTIGRIK
tara:strand:- start:89 stop:259 length:171 start_codon:yes stop_codon:yes gene_type:complete